MVDIQSVAADIRRGKKKKERKKPQGKNIMSASATQGGHKKQEHSFNGLFSGTVWVYGTRKVNYFELQ